MAFGLKGSHIVAVLIAGGVIGWMLQGDIIVGGQAESENATPPPAERAGSEQILQKVRFTTISPEIREQVLSLRGRTEAASIVQVRAETSGVVEERFIEKGDFVKEGDLLCRLDAGVRKSALLQAKTGLIQAESDYLAHKQLQEQGYSTNAKLLAMQSAKDAAKARLEQAEKELENIDVIAKASGTAQDPIAEIGNLLNPGDICATIVQSNPMKFIGQVSERSVAAIKNGDRALVGLVSGEQVSGKIRYIAPTADQQTRTFRVEIEIPNDQNRIRDGITATANIALASDEAYQIKASWLTLADNGNVGVRVIGDDDVVDFVELKILAQTPDTMWVSGLANGQRVITVGQEYVAAGQKVLGVEETAKNQTSLREQQS
ncbi:MULTISPECIES: efflux RND transporter periplasmic adaptor subunit [unclassified Lentilitoribacter]|jgi:multidrug efflux system membrane fusion protein|uniref:efflux RND transporter periplasmic adaptor subunit n=1 Tax=unclassified Lentilitoribacter TaxID=2647570 RepID=UPI0013A69E6C|nr:efflux RND transporter periplasmic adaptor subunit [Lentilitoribacter sp. Alg239-R112]